MGRARRSETLRKLSQAVSMVLGYVCIGNSFLAVIFIRTTAEIKAMEVGMQRSASAIIKILRLVEKDVFLNIISPSLPRRGVNLFICSNILPSGKIACSHWHFKRFFFAWL